MNKRKLLVRGAIAIIVLELLAALYFLLDDKLFAILAPMGTIADDQKALMLQASLLMLFVVIPVLLMSFGFAWRYRDRGDKHTATYAPSFTHSTKLETIWWAIPIILIGVLSWMAYTSSHQLDPYRPLSSDTKPLTVQVVALDWKWLFIYPEQGIATVNYLHIPEDTPINFSITADAPMNSFWIPQLGGQVYAMAGMQTRLHLMASEQGTFNGSSANLSGEGFADMRFTVHATSSGDFETWAVTAKNTGSVLDQQSYDQLAKPTRDHEKMLYGTVQSSLYEDIINKYMGSHTKMTHPGGSH